MKKLTLLLAMAFLLAGSHLTAQDMKLDDILKAHFDAIGQKKILKVKSVVMTGTFNQMGMELPIKIMQKRPNKFYMELEIQGSKVQQVYNGEIAWFVAPMMGSMEPTDITGPELEQFKQQADMDGYLWNWKERGFKCELVGKEDMEGTDVYNVKLTKDNGGIDNYYFDAENFMILKSKSKVFQQGSEVEQESYSSNFKTVDGITGPYSQEIKQNDMVVATMVVNEVLYNADVDDAIFVKPVSGQ